MFSFGNGGPAKTGTMATSASSAASWGLCLCSPFGKVPPVPAPGGRRGVTGQKRVQCYCVIMLCHSSSWGLRVTPNFSTLRVLHGTDGFRGDCET